MPADSSGLGEWTRFMQVTELDERIEELKRPFKDIHNDVRCQSNQQDLYEDCWLCLFSRIRVCGIHAKEIKSTWRINQALQDAAWDAQTSITSRCQPAGDAHLSQGCAAPRAYSSCAVAGLSMSATTSWQSAPPSSCIGEDQASITCSAGTRRPSTECISWNSSASSRVDTWAPLDRWFACPFDRPSWCRHPASRLGKPKPWPALTSPPGWSRYQPIPFSIYNHSLFACEYTQSGTCHSL